MNISFAIVAIHWLLLTATYTFQISIVTTQQDDFTSHILSPFFTTGNITTVHYTYIWVYERERDPVT